MDQTVKLAIIYIRVSSKKQFLQGHSPESQEKVCQEFALAKGFKVLKVFIEPGFTGKSKLIERKVGREMLAFLTNQPGVSVIVNDYTRASRKLKDHYEDVDTLEALGCQIISATQYFGEGIEAEYAKDNLILAGQLLASVNRKEVIRKMTHRASQGFYMAKPPFGYKFGVTEGGKTLVFSEPEATSLKECFEIFATKQIWSPVDFRKALETRGYKKARTTVEELLRNPIYAGMFQMKGEFIQTPLMQGKHEALISLDVWEAIQEHLDGRSRATYKTPNEDEFVFKGILHCSKCKKSLVCSISRAKGKNYAYYVCKNRKCEFENISYSVKETENQFGLFLNEFYLDSTSEMALKLFFIDYLRKVSKESTISLESLKKQFKEASASLNMYLGRVRPQTPLSVLEIYENEIDKLNQEKAKLEIKISGFEVQQEKDLKVYQNKIEAIIESHKNVMNQWFKLSLQQKRNLVQLAFNGYLEYDKKQLYQNPSTSLIYQLYRHFKNPKFAMVDLSVTKSKNIFQQIDEMYMNLQEQNLLHFMGR